jgi:hypothetical protein
MVLRTYCMIPPCRMYSRSRGVNEPQDRLEAAAVGIDVTVRGNRPGSAPASPAMVKGVVAGNRRTS